MLRNTAGHREIEADRQAAGGLRVLHVVVQAGPTNSQWHEHCLPVADARQLTVCSLLPAMVQPDPRIARLEGRGTMRDGLRVLRHALRQGDYDIVHVHAPVSAALLVAACALERLRLENAVFSLHTSWQNLRPRNRVLTAAAFAVVPTVVACSQAAAHSIPPYVTRLLRRRLHVVPNGVDVDRIDSVLGDPVHEALESVGRRTGTTGVTAVTVGRLIPVKDQATLLAAFARAAGPDDRLVVIGEGPLHADLGRRGAALGITDRLQMMGLLPREEVYRVLASADFFLSSSRVEGLPVAVLEAMAAGLPAVLSDIPPHREIVGDTAIAELVSVGDVDGMAEAIDRLRELDPARRQAAGAEARRRVLDQFSLSAMNEGYERVYSTVSARELAGVGGTA